MTPCSAETGMKSDRSDELIELVSLLGYGKKYSKLHIQSMIPSFLHHEKRPIELTHGLT